LALKETEKVGAVPEFVFALKPLNNLK